MLSTCPSCGEILRKPKRKRVAQRLPGRSRAEVRAERKRRHAEETARIRAERMEIAGHRCEFSVGDVRCRRTTNTDVLHKGRDGR